MVPLTYPWIKRYPWTGAGRICPEKELLSMLDDDKIKLCLKATVLWEGKTRNTYIVLTPYCRLDEAEVDPSVTWRILFAVVYLAILNEDFELRTDTQINSSIHKQEYSSLYNILWGD